MWFAKLRRPAITKDPITKQQQSKVAHAALSLMEVLQTSGCLEQGKFEIEFANAIIDVRSPKDSQAKTPDTDALLPCPFCDQNLWREGFGWTHNTEKECPLNGMAFIDGSRALAVWNRRTPQPSVTSEELANMVSGFILEWERFRDGWNMLPDARTNFYNRCAQAILTQFNVSKKE